MTEDNRLLDVIDELTQPSRVKVIQDGAVGSGLEGQQTVTIEMPPLLEQLQEAIKGTIGIGGSGSLKSERNLLDGDALYKFVMISTLIEDWARVAKAEITKGDPGATLRAWYVRYQQTAHEPASDRFYESKMNGWVAQIKAKLDPPRVKDLPDRCPVCDADTWWNPNDKQQYLRPLVIEYRETGADLIQQARAMCRACAQVWSVRELAFALEEPGLTLEQKAGQSAV